MLKARAEEKRKQAAADRGGGQEREGARKRKAVL